MSRCAPRLGLRIHLSLIAGWSAFALPAPAAATWADDRTTPHLLDLVAIDRTGEPGWLFGPEDVAGDGLASFDAPERASDVRSVYLATDARRLWLRAYLSYESALPEGVRVFVFFDADDDRRTGGSAVAPEIDPDFTRDDSAGGYDVVLGMQVGTALGGVWRHDPAAAAYVLADAAPLDAVVETETDVDPLRLSGDRHAYLQVALDAAALDIAPRCDARLLVRSSGADTAGDLDVGALGPCIPADRDGNRVGDLLEDGELSCEADDECPVSGLCFSGRCRYPSYCRVDADCAGDERCDADSICKVEGESSCGLDEACAGGLVCASATNQCQPCSVDTQCSNGERCAASGRCVDASSPSGTPVAAGDVRLEAGQEVQGGAGTCALPRTPRPTGRAWPFVLIAALALLRRRRRVPPGLLGVPLALLVWFASPVVHAQVDAERLKPAATHDGWINAEGSAVRHPDDAWELGAVFNYAHHPLVIADAEGNLVDALVAGRLGLDLIGSVSLAERFAIGLALPVFWQHGDAVSRSLGVGDLRLVPKLELVNDVDVGVGLSLAAELRAPTHGGDFSGGARGFAFFPKVILDHRYRGGLRIGANLGVILREDRDYLNLTSGDEFAYAAAMGYRFGGLSGKTEIGVELNGAANLLRADDEEVALEAFGFLRRALDPEWEIKGGAGAGVLEGYGVPTWRVFIGVSFAPTSHDRDYDGVPDSKDACVEFAEDRDGVQDSDGCPEEDADADHDGVSDEDDECPKDKETINGVQDEDGCPDAGDRRVVFDDGEFIVLDTIRFTTGSAEIHPSAHSLLDQVALTLRASPEIDRIRIEGHTDDTGPREINMALSQQRALAVKHYLVRRGVSPKRLSLRSYGPDRPRESGTDQRARAKNRRVEFIVE